ncbi:DUF4118 domain-containing protein (plasmid) [Kovacikia minuta CCNUW1]|uniref:DUF4118 domain-containing protein n=1 Tax=Kovacikia minuta TaxID=2931930 RepID=UPI001CCC991D|nr:DUF4118 domain-containing protein [Kovacikia minuta]UBF30579.1 DUF4118 domain-containing protein [Kovacikia minuta CCNUW1]
MAVHPTSIAILRGRTMTDRKKSVSVGKKFPGSTQLLSSGVALVSVAVALGIGLLLKPVIQPTPTTLFFVAVMISAWYGGLGPGMVATVLSTLAIDYCFIEPVHSLHNNEPGTLLRLGVFVLAALLVSGLNESRRIALRREQTLRQTGEAAQAEAQAEIRDRKQAELEREELFQQLAAERAQFEAVLRQLPEGVMIADAASVI